jgi:alkanesulfonate monooxygenase SsuD/methylene tetrahydromethanopterin reductase-like flavin-dependent oxidoreductase (luciferase family)
LKFGLRLSVQCTMEESLKDHFTGILRQVEVARELGFDMVSAGQHYLTTPFQAMQLMPALSRITAVSGDMQVASAVVLLPLHNPVDMAEQVASLDILSGGRFVFGVALGYREVEYRSFGLEKKALVGRFEESLGVMKRLWTEDTVTHEGRHFTVAGGSMAIRPLQKPYPPIWIGGNTEAAVARAARLGHPWLANPHAHIDNLERQIELYRRVQRKTDGVTAVTDFPIMLEMFVANSRKQAIEIAGPHLESKYRAYSQWGQDKVMPWEKRFTAGIAELAPGRYILGDPQECIEQIKVYRDRLGINFMVLRVQWPGMSNEEAIRAIELLGRQVIPALRDDQENP